VARSSASLCAGALILALCLVLPAGASADTSFCAPGSSAGQCNEQSGVASDFESGRLYVADSGNNRIDVFEANGEFLFAFGWRVNAAAPEEKLQTCNAVTGCLAGTAGLGAGQLKGPRRVAVDNDAASPSHHDVYVFDSGNRRIEKFDPSGALLASKENAGSGTGPGEFSDSVDPIAVSPSGELYVGDTPKTKEPRVERFDSSLSLLGECELPHKDKLNAGFAVDSAGDVFATFNESNPIFKFNPSCGEEGSPFPRDPGRAPLALAIGAGDGLFATEEEARVGNASEAFRTITELEPSGAYLKRFGYGLGLIGTPGAANAIAALHTTEGDVFASLTGGPNRISYLTLPPPGPVVAQLSLEAETASTSATLAAELNPEGTKPTKYRFEYVDLHSFETEGGFASPNTKKTTEVEVPIAPGTPEKEEEELFALHAAEAQIGCLDPITEIGSGNCLAPETKYRYRAVGKNSDGEGEAAEGEFETRPGLEIEETWASEATTTGARLNAKVNPLGIPTSGYFEYVDDATYRKDVEELGEGHGFDHAKQVPDVAHGQSPLDFGAGAASVRSVNLQGLAPGRSYHYRLVATDGLLTTPIAGPERILRPFATPSSPPCENDRFRAGPGAELPDCRAYEMVSPLDKNNGDIVPLGEFTSKFPAALDVSSTSGEKVSYTTSTAFGDTKSAPYSAEYVAERGEGGWQSHAINSPRGGLVAPLSAQINNEFKLFSPDLCFAWQRTVAEPPLSADAVPGYANLYKRTDQSCGGAPDYEALTTVKPPSADEFEYADLELQGASADGNTAVFVAPDNLEAGMPPEPASCTSEHKGCELRLYEKRAGGEPKFLCLLPGGAPVAPCQAGSGGGGDGRSVGGNFHNAISADGERIYWSAGGKLYLRVGGTETLPVSEEGEALSGTGSSAFRGASKDGSKALFLTQKSGVSDLYEYDAESEEATPVAHEVIDSVGMSEDGSHVYFASEEEIEGTSGATEGKPNLYLDDEGSFRFIATLASGDLNAKFSAVTAVPVQHMARLSEDGSSVAFISTAPLTGYDNTDAASPEECGEGHPKAICDAELFLYEADANEGAGKLICASCNPSGARPLGTDISVRIHTGIHTKLFAAGWVPAWENNQYASRALSANGRRLFFESSDALSPLDTNHATDVYEWEQAEEGKCTEASAGFDPASGGCVELISSGKGQRESLFVDADPEGKNAFFTTLSSLVPQDPGLIDVYDAREGGGFPPPPPRKVECEGEACQSPPGAPGVLTPASSAFGGEEAPEEAKAKKKKKKGHKKKGHKKKAMRHGRRAR
jgi:DNA-binding beta-propeller fold protein YncE